MRMKGFVAVLAASVFLIPSVSFGAIALSTSTQTSVTAQTITLSHTITGSNTLLLVGIYPDSTTASLSTTPTYAGVGMTLINHALGSPVNGDTYLYGLLNPTTGTNNIVATTTDGTVNTTIYGLSYTGVSQSGFPLDASTSLNLTVAEQNVTTTLTTVANNTWATLFARVGGVASTCSAGAGATQRGTSSASQACIFDSNGPITPAGSYSMTANGTSASDRWTTNMVSFAPAAAVSAPTPQVVWW